MTYGSLDLFDLRVWLTRPRADYSGSEMLCLVHGDDFVCVGEAADLKWLEDRLKERFEIKSKTMGLRDGESREERILNRAIRVTEAE